MRGCKADLRTYQPAPAVASKEDAASDFSGPVAWRLLLEPNEIPEGSRQLPTHLFSSFLSRQSCKAQLQRRIRALPEGLLSSACWPEPVLSPKAC